MEIPLEDKLLGYNDRHPLFKTWRGMIYRCKSHHYENYFGKGITVSEEWRTSFKQFVLDMGAKPSLKHSIDRIDNNGNYCKENCRWATSKEQMNNTSRNNPNSVKFSMKQYRINCKNKGTRGNIRKLNIPPAGTWKWRLKLYPHLNR